MTAARQLGIGIVGAGTMAGAHSLALSLVPPLYPELPLQPRLVAVADIYDRLARRLADRYGYSRVEPDWRPLVDAPDIDLVVTCLPPAHNVEVVLGAAAAGKHVVSEKPLATSGEAAAELLAACRAAGVFHGLGAAYRWTPALRQIRRLLDDGALGEVRSFRACFLLDYAADPDVPLLWRFQKAMAGGGIAIDTGYHLVDTARYLVGEIETVQGLTAIAYPERPLPSADATGNRGGSTGDRASVAMGPVDVEDAAAAIVTFEGGPYGVLETSRMTRGRRVAGDDRSERTEGECRRIRHCRDAVDARAATADRHAVIVEFATLRRHWADGPGSVQRGTGAGRQIALRKLILTPMSSMLRFHSSSICWSRAVGVELALSSSGEPSGSSRYPSPSRST